MPSPVTGLLWAGPKPLLPQTSRVEGRVPTAADMRLPAGMGSQSRPQSVLQGFGYSKERGHTGECCGTGAQAEGEGRMGPVCPSLTSVPPRGCWGGAVGSPYLAGEKPG